VSRPLGADGAQFKYREGGLWSGGLLSPEGISAAHAIKIINAAPIALPHQHTFTRRYSSLRVANLSSYAVNRRWVMIEQPLRLSCAIAFGFRGLLLNTEAQT